MKILKVNHVLKELKPLRHNKQIKLKKTNVKVKIIALVLERSLKEIMIWSQFKKIMRVKTNLVHLKNLFKEIQITLRLILQMLKMKLCTLMTKTSPK